MDNIVFNSIELHNFLSIHEAKVNLSQQGFVMVRGQNNESSVTQSNGAGKSTIFDAIFWTITGTTIRGTSEVVNEKYQAWGCECTLDFLSGKSHYVITRYKGHPDKGNSCYVYKDDELLADQTKKAQEMISSNLPSMTTDILSSIVLLGQGLPNRFSSLTPIKRKELLENLSGTSSDISALKVKLSTEKIKHQTVNTLNNETILKNKTKIDTLTDSNVFIQKQIDSSKSEDEVNQEIEKLNEQIEEANNSIKDNDEEIEKLKEEIEGYNNEISDIDEQINEFNGKVDEVNEQISSLVDDKVNLTSVLNTTKNYLGNIKTGVCPTCGRPYEVTEQTEQQIETLKEKITVTENQLNVLKEQNNKLNEMLQQHHNEISELNGKKSSAQSSIKFNNDKINNLQVDAQKSSIQSLIKSCEDKIKDLREQLESSKQLQEQLENNEKIINDLTIENMKLEDSNKKEENVLSCIDYLDYQLSRDFKGYLLQEIIDYVSQKTQYYSKYLFTNGKLIKVELDRNKITIRVGNQYYENLSGGERQRVDLATQFALRDAISTISGFSCNLLVLDEVFDNLDAQGSEALMSLVITELKDTDSVFIVTHHSEIDIPYDSQITVVKNSDGVSQIE